MLSLRHLRQRFRLLRPAPEPDPPQLAAVSYAPGSSEVMFHGTAEPSGDAWIAAEEPLDLREWA